MRQNVAANPIKQIDSGQTPGRLVLANRIYGDLQPFLFLDQRLIGRLFAHRIERFKVFGKRIIDLFVETAKRSELLPIEDVLRAIVLDAERRDDLAKLVLFAF